MRRYAIMFSLMLLFSGMLVPGAMAQYNEDALTEGDLNEMKSFANPFGAEVRLLQLERKLEWNILAGTEVVTFLHEKNESLVLSGLEGIIDQMEELLEDVRNSPRDGEAGELAQNFVSLKRSAIDLTKDFRTAASEYIEPSDREALAERIKNIDRNSLDNTDNMIQQAKAEFNAYRLENMLGVLGIENQALLERVRSEGLNPGRIRNELKATLGNMTDSQKQEAGLRASENRVKHNVAGKAINGTVSDNFTERMRERKEELLQKMEQKMEQAKNRTEYKSLTQRIKNMNMTQQRLEEQTQKLEEMRKRVRANAEKITQNLGNVQQRLEEQAQNIQNKINGKGGG